MLSRTTYWIYPFCDHTSSYKQSILWPGKLGREMILDPKSRPHGGKQAHVSRVMKTPCTISRPMAPFVGWLLLLLSNVARTTAEKELRKVHHRRSGCTYIYIYIFTYSGCVTKLSVHSETSCKNTDFWSFWHMNPRCKGHGYSGILPRPTK